MKSRRGALTLLSGSGVNFALRFGRNALIARLLSVSDFGIASTFVVAMSMVQMFTDLNLDKMIIQNKAGNNPDYIAAVKGVGVLRSLLVAVLLFVTAAPVARLMAQPDIVWAYQCMAIVPLLAAFMHPDLTRLQREMNFGPVMRNNTFTMVLTLALVWPLALWLEDYRVMLFVYVIEAGSRMLLSWLAAERPFRIRWDLQVAKDGMRFGWPLMLAGIITFAVLQGDRIIVANRFGAEALGLFSVALTLTMVPMLQASVMVRTFFLPVISWAQDDDAMFNFRANFIMQATLATAVLAILGYALTGPAVLVLVFGQKFAGAGAFIGLLAIAFALQLMRGGTATIAMARGSTMNMLIANIVRMLFVPAAVAVAFSGGSILDVLAISAVGQLVGVAVSVLMLYRRTGLKQFRQMILPYGFGLASLVCVTWEFWLTPKGFATFGPVMMLACLFFVAQLASSQTMLRELRRAIGFRFAR